MELRKKEQSLMEVIERLRNGDTLNDMDCAFVSTQMENIETLQERDKVLEELWNQLEDIPMDEDTQCMEEAFFCFPAGTAREDIWHWFDKRHSKGIAYLLYKEAVDD